MKENTNNLFSLIHILFFIFFIFLFLTNIHYEQKATPFTLTYLFNYFFKQRQMILHKIKQKVIKCNAKDESFGSHVTFFLRYPNFSCPRLNLKK